MLHLSKTAELPQLWAVSFRRYSVASTAPQCKDYYAVLDVSHTASMQQIKAAYYAKSKKVHPDVNSAPEAHQEFLVLTRAYEILGNANERLRYDQDLQRGQNSPLYDDRGNDFTYPGIYHQFRPRGSTSRREWRVPHGSNYWRPPPPGFKMYDFEEHFRQHYGEQIRYQYMHRQMHENMRTTRYYDDAYYRVIYEKSRRQMWIFITLPAFIIMFAIIGELD